MMVWIPTVDDVYPAGFQSAVRVGALTEPLEGACRPGHFEGQFKAKLVSNSKDSVYRIDQGYVYVAR